MLGEPSDGAEMVSQILYGEAALVLQACGDYFCIRTSDAYEGWVKASALVPEAADVFAHTMACCVVSLLEPIFSAEPPHVQQTLLTLGTIVHVRHQYPPNASMRMVVNPDGSLSLISASALEPSAADAQFPTPDAIVTTALRFVGVPYLWGGRTTFGMDCSGLTQRAYSLNGIILPRDADLQAAADGLVAIPPEDMQPADLLFFGGHDELHHREIAHVAMAIDRHRFVHSAGGRGVCIASFETEPALGQRLRLCGRLERFISA